MKIALLPWPRSGSTFVLKILECEFKLTSLGEPLHTYPKLDFVAPANSIMKIMPHQINRIDLTQFDYIMLLDRISLPNAICSYIVAEKNNAWQNSTVFKFIADMKRVKQLVNDYIRWRKNINSIKHNNISYYQYENMILNNAWRARLTIDKKQDIGIVCPFNEPKPSKFDYQKHCLNYHEIDNYCHQMIKDQLIPEIDSVILT